MPFFAQKHFDISTKDIQSWSFDNVKYDEDEPIYISALKPEISISAKQGRTLVRKLVAGLRKLGLKHGEVVCVHSFNDIHYPLAFHGAVGAGGVFAGTNPGYTQYELEHALKIAKVKFILTQPALAEQITKAAKAVGITKGRIIMFNPNGEESIAGHPQWSDLLSHGEADWVRFDDLQRAQTTTAARLFSSGTTGLPKAADLTHYNLIAQHELVYTSHPRPWRAKRLLALPMFHAAAAPSAFCSQFVDGSQAYVLPRFDLENWFRSMENYQITDLAVVPPIAITVINSPLNKKYSLKAVKTASCGAAPLDKGPQARLQALLGKEAPFTQVWGMTETSCIATRFPHPEDDDTGSVGYPLPNIDIKLVDDDGKDITDYDVRGELCVRGPTIINGYFENDKQNAIDWDKDRFFHTGDIAYITRGSEKIYIVDRKKELIKVRGFQVAPAELEGVLLVHDAIADAAVIGVPDPSSPDSSELPRAYITPKEGSKLSEEDVHVHIKAKLAKFKSLLGGVVFTDDIPKNASGKILKRSLRERAKEELKQSGKAKL